VPERLGLADRAEAATEAGQLVVEVLAVEPGPRDLGPGRRVDVRDLAPGLRERCEHLVRGALPGQDRAGLDRVGGSRGHGLDPGLLEALHDPLVAAAAEGRVLARDVDAGGAGLVRHPGDDVGGVARADDERAVHGLVEGDERRLEPGPSRTTGPGQPRVADEQGDDLAPGGGRHQRGVVGQPQVAADPPDRGHRSGRAGSTSMVAMPPP